MGFAVYIFPGIVIQHFRVHIEIDFHRKEYRTTGANLSGKIMGSVKYREDGLQAGCGVKLCYSHDTYVYRKLVNALPKLALVQGFPFWKTFPSTRRHYGWMVY